MLGTKLIHYEITRRLGSGGMGEVYQATDSKLGRSVAIKILSEAFAQDHDRVSRLLREARVLASLNHPNIASIFGLEESGGRHFLVMELVTGETLAERIKRGPIPTREAIRIAGQIAEALEAAHLKGVVHRDLKPANVMITRDGKVKVLDFGLAKAFDEQQSTMDASDSPTAIITATHPGMVLGTAAYMSPEQIRGEPVDNRTDIWAFGVVLYEMLTGESLHNGKSISDTMATVLTREPSFERLPHETRRLLRNCLEKDRAKRLRDIGDATRLIDDEPLSYERRNATWQIIAGGLSLTAGVASWGWWRASRTFAPPAEQHSVLDLDLGPDVWVGSSTGPTAILSPDQSRIVFVSAPPDKPRLLFTRLLEQPTATPLAGTEDVYGPFFSPDGQWIGFWAGGKMKKIRVDGGEPITLCDAPALRGGVWLDEDNIVATLDTRAGLSKVSTDGNGKVTPFTTLDAGEATHRFPQLLPDQKGVLFSVSASSTNYAEAGIAVIGASSGWKKRILLEHAGISPRYLSTGHLVYVANGKLYAVPFNPNNLNIEGAAVPVLEGVSTDVGYGFAQLDFARNGTLLYRQGPVNGGLYEIQWLDRSGKATPIRQAASYFIPRLAPDGSSRLAVVETQGSISDILVYDWETGGRTKLTSGLRGNSFPLWTPDGKYIFFQSADGIFWARAEGGEKDIFLKSQVGQSPTSFTGDGKLLVFFERNPAGGAFIKVVAVQYDSGRPQAGEPKIILQTPSTTPHPAFSPDGHWLAYASTDDGPYQVYVCAYPVKEKDRGLPVSIAGGHMPVWSRSRDRKELFYRGDDGRIMVVTYSVEGDRFFPNPPNSYSEKRRLGNTGLTPSFDLSPDGSRLAVLIPPEEAQFEKTRSHMTLVLNFFDEVRRRVAVKTPTIILPQH